MIPNSGVLISIYFSYNGLDDKCAPILKDYLSTNTVLEVLKLNVSTVRFKVGFRSQLHVRLQVEA